MRFGLALDLTSASIPLATRVEDGVALIQRAERCGFESVFVGEAYPSALGPTPMPAALLALASLARGTHLRLGTGVVLLPVHQPLLLAYETSVLDQLCDGRLVLGVGVGNEALLRRFGVDVGTVGAHVDDTIALLRALWSGADGYRGTHLSVDRAISPLPLQRGGPPIWVAGYVRRSAERAAENDGYYAGTPCSMSTLRTQVRRYHAALAERGKDGQASVSINRLAIVAPTEREALELGRAYAGPVLQRYAAQGSMRGEARSTIGTAAELIDRFHEDYCLIGTPDQVTERARRYAEAGVTQLQLRLAPWGLPVELAARTIELFAGEVAPRLAAVS